MSARSTGRPSGGRVYKDDWRQPTNGVNRISTARPLFTAFPAAVHMGGVGLRGRKVANSNGVNLGGG